MGRGSPELVRILTSRAWFGNANERHSFAVTEPNRFATRFVNAYQRIVSWSFVYIYFSYGTPFDAPNRSEPCRS